MTGSLYWTIILLYSYIDIVVLDHCYFPVFLQSQQQNGRLQPWVTRSWWINMENNPRMREQREIYVDGSYMMVTLKENSLNCERKNRRFTPYKESKPRQNCQTRQNYNRTCLYQEGNKYRVAQYDEKSMVYLYACMSFTLRSSNVIQVTEGTWRQTNAPDLCNDKNLAIDSWPWIASWKPESISCPVSGGFTFRTISRLTNQDVCKDDWRRSKLEIECMKGDGMDFFAPKGSNCTPFLLTGEWKRLYCLGGWRHGNYTFMITAGEGNDHHFCIRFPANPGKTFVALLYFSPICPTDEDGQATTGIDYYELHLRRTDHGECDDENEQFCKQHAMEGMCEKMSHRYLPHCRKSCGLCGEIKNPWTDLAFSELVRGRWLLFDDGKEESIIINDTHLYISSLGHFKYIERVPVKKLYKLVSSFQNGCSMRYTCIELHRPHNNILQFRLGGSFREDKSHTDICSFKKDIYSGLNYRSSSRRNLLLKGQLWPSPCRLSGTIPFEAHFSGQKCKGNFSDWNENTCTYNTFVTMTDNCSGKTMESQYKCIAYLDDDFKLSDKMSSKMILTQSMDGSNQFVCWVLTTFPGEDFTYPVTRMYKMPSLQCSSFENVNKHLVRHKHRYYHMLYEQKSKATACRRTNTPVLSTTIKSQNITFSVISRTTLRNFPIKTPVFSKSKCSGVEYSLALMLTSIFQVCSIIL